MVSRRVIALVLPLFTVGCEQIIGIRDYTQLDASEDAPIDAVDAPVDGPFGSATVFIKAPNTGSGDQFGRSVSLSSDGMTLAVGAAWERSASIGINSSYDELATFAGAVYIYVRSGGAWSHQAFIKASNTDAFDYFGTSVAVSGDGDTLVVGATGEASSSPTDQNNDGSPYSGAIYVFVRSGTTWTQQAYLKPANIGSSDYFGDVVAISGDGNTIAVGAPYEDGGATGINGPVDEAMSSAGAVYLFRRTSGVWAQEAYVKASNTNVNDTFGRSVALSLDGGTLAVGAAGEDSSTMGINTIPNEAALESGAAYVFVRAGVNWVQQAYIKASNSGMNDAFGSRLTIAGDGNTLAISAPGEASINVGVNGGQLDDQAPSAGAVYVLVRNATVWSQQAYIKASNTGGGDYFGHGVSISPSGSRLVVGAYLEDSNANGVNGDELDNISTNSGAAYLFERAGTVWAQRYYLKATHSDPFDFFGWSAAITDTAIMIGCYAEDSSAVNVGGDELDNAASSSGAVYAIE